MGYYSEQHAEMQKGHGMSECEFHHAMQEQALDAAIKWRTTFLKAWG